MSQRSSSRSSRTTKKQTTEERVDQAQERPTSPNSASRVEEKRELAGLNNRLAYYINHVRNLETDKGKLIQKVEILEECKTQEVTSIKKLYAVELSESRKLLDIKSKELTVLKVENDALKKNEKDLKNNIDNTLASLKQAEKKLLNTQVTNNDLQARLADAISSNKKYELENARFAKDIQDLEKKIALCQERLNEETVLRVSNEDKVQSLREEDSFNRNLHKLEMNDSIITRSFTEVRDTVDGKQDDYIAKLQVEMDKMRKENDLKIKQTREETEAFFSKKVNEMSKMAKPGKELSEHSQTEMARTRKNVEELQCQVTQLLSQANDYQTRINDLESQLKRERAEHGEQMANSVAEITALRRSFRDHVRDYSDLLELKVQLDLEINAYRKLLEGEESRLDISLTPGRPSRKRKRGFGEDSFSEIGSSCTNESSRFSVNATHSDQVGIVDIDTEGSYVKIENFSKKDVPLGGYVLKVSASDIDCFYKFNSKLQIKANTVTTVWSNSSQKTHSPPSDLLMKSGHNFPPGETITAVLMDTNDKQIASREICVREEIEEDESDEDKNKCSIM